MDPAQAFFTAPAFMMLPTQILVTAPHARRCRLNAWAWYLGGALFLMNSNPPFENRKDVSSISRTHVTPGSCPSGRHCPGLHFAGDILCSTRARCHSDITRELGIFLPRASVADLTSSPPHFLMWKWARTFKKCTCEIRFFTHSHLLLELLPKHHIAIRIQE